MVNSGISRIFLFLSVPIYVIKMNSSEWIACKLSLSISNFMSANPRNDLEPPCLKNVFQVVKQPKFIFCQANARFWIYLKSEICTTLYSDSWNYVILISEVEWLCTEQLGFSTKTTSVITFHSISLVFLNTLVSRGRCRSIQILGKMYGKID